MTDAVLFDKWRSERDAEAFRELATRYSAMVYATCLRVLRNPQEAEEAAQECFEKLAQAPRLDAPYAGPWLHKVATNRALDRLRVEGRRRTREDRYARERDTSLTPEWEDIYPLVDEAIAGLPEELRVPLVQHFLENRTHDAIAQELGVSRTTITYRLQKALERVRRTLKRRGVNIAGAAFATMLGEKMAEAAVVPAALEAAIGRIAVAGLKVSPVALGGVWVLAGGMAGKVLLGAAVVAIATGFAWQLFVPEQSAPIVARHVEADQAAATEETGSSPKAVAAQAKQAPVTATATVPQAAEEGCTIAGHVYDVKTGHALAGIYVHADLAQECKGSKAISGEDGAYRIVGLAPGTYRVRASPGDNYLNDPERGYRTFEASVDLQNPAEGIDFRVDPGVNIFGRVVSADGKPVSEAQVGAILGEVSGMGRTQSQVDGSFTLNMQGPGTNLRMLAKSEDAQSLLWHRDGLGSEGLKGVELVLTEPLTAGIEGKLLLSDGRPAAGYSVHLQSGVMSFLVNLSEAKTNADGTFQLDKIAAATYEVGFGSPGELGWSFPDGLEKLTVEKGIVLKNVVLRLPETKDVFSITGRVVDKTGKSLEGIRVVSKGPGNTSAGERGALTDREGAFTLDRLAEGSYSVKADCFDIKSHSPASFPEVQAGTQGLKIVLDGLGRVEGRVVSDRDGKPISEFETYFSEGKNKVVDPQMLANRGDIKDPNGAFLRKDVYTGTQTFVVKAPGYAPALQVVEVKEGQTTTAAEFRLEAAAKLVGNVVDENGKPIANVGIYLNVQPGIGQGNALALSGEDGTFSLELPSPQVRRLHAYLPEYPRVNVGIDQLKNIVLKKGGFLEGHVTLDGQPLEGCNVIGNSGNFATTAPDGSYRLGPLATGTVNVGASWKRRERNARQDVTIQAGGTAVLDFAFPSADASIEGTAMMSGKPVADVQVVLSVDTAAGEESCNTKTDASGHYLFSSVPPGTAHLALVGTTDEREMAMGRAELELEPGAAVQHDFTLGGPGTITGTVTGVPADCHAMAILLPQDATLPASMDMPAFNKLMQRQALGFTGCGQDGTYKITQVSSGDYIVLTVVMPRVITPSDPASAAPLLTDSATAHVGDGAVTVNLAPR
ncbi:MAG: sigma-70 family RNA polymerase sigma factor [FCB group bacterium]|jgi:RNA polymerase sigma factor (sigma-70 family)|nr:sigma-70 family RNA polymerase sigma factor [FCB group bacterium]